METSHAPHSTTPFERVAVASAKQAAPAQDQQNEDMDEAEQHVFGVVQGSTTDAHTVRCLGVPTPSDWLFARHKHPAKLRQQKRLCVQAIHPFRQSTRHMSTRERGRESERGVGMQRCALPH